MTNPTDSTIPDETRLRLMCQNNMPDVAQTFIDKYKLPYKIENGQLVDALKGTDLWLNKFITQDKDCLDMKRDITKLAKVSDSVLITGESGTGKELIARSLQGERTGRTIAANCAGFPEALIESELFGYMKGSFTGAEGNRQGLCAEAKEGILFLDEVGELPLPIQAKLLRAIQEKKIRRVGGKDEEEISCRFVCATHRNIKKMVENGQFRLDLYARISTFEIDVKPLRERLDDVPLIIASMTNGKEFLKALDQSQRTVKDLDLSLNVRSLEQYVKRYAVYGRIVG